MLRLPRWRVVLILFLITTLLIVVGKFTAEIHWLLIDFGIQQPQLLGFPLVPMIVAGCIALAVGGTVAATSGLRTVARWTLGNPASSNRLSG